MIPEKHIRALSEDVLSRLGLPVHPERPLPLYPTDQTVPYVIAMPHPEDGVDISMHLRPMMKGQPEPCRMSPGLHVHNYFEMMYVESGAFHNAVDGEDMCLTGRHIAILAPDIPHAPYLERNSDIVINLMFSPKLMDAAYRCIYGGQTAMSGFLYNYIYGLPNGAQYLMIERSAAIDSIVESMVATYLEKPPMALERMRAMLCELLVALCISYNDGTDRISKKDAQLSDIVRYMRANYTTVTLSELSEVFHYSTAHISRMISQGMNRSFRSLCMDYKLEGALKLLKYTDLSVSQIASSLNLSDAGYLSRLIRADCGLSPTEYRQRYSQL